MNFKTYDFHELYVKTFHACDGERYIFYNHEKHMKGISEMRTYNNFIRKKIDKKNNWKGENLIKRYKSEDQNEGDSNNNRMYKFEPYNDVKEKEIEKKGYKSQVIFRRYKRQNFGKFIRK